MRERFGFGGAVFSDDLAMAGAGTVGGSVERARRALAAGCDMVLVCNDRKQAAEVVAALAVEDRPVSVARLMRLHGHPAAGIDRELESTSAWAEARALVDAIRDEADA